MNQQEIPTQVTHPFGPKWTRIARTDPGISEILDVYSRNKRSSKLFLDHRGILKKIKLISQVDKENETLLSKDGS